MVKISGESDFRNGKQILKGTNEEEVRSIESILNDRKLDITLDADEKQRDLSGPIQNRFKRQGWQDEEEVTALSGPKYDLFREGVPIEIELGHKRMVYADFIKFLSDYSNTDIPAAVMVVAENSEDFGNSWHNSRKSTVKKLRAIEDNYLVPIWIIGISP